MNGRASRSMRLLLSLATMRRLAGGLVSVIIVVVPAGVFVRESLSGAARQTQVAVPAVRLAPHALARFQAFKRYQGAVPVVTYHDISDSGTRYAVSPQQFATQIAMIHAAGFTTITARQLQRFLEGEGALPRKPIMLTFDDGASSTWRVADPVLARYRMHAVAFIITSEIGRHAPYYLDERELKALRDSGRWDLEAHTDNGHHSVLSSPDGSVEPFLTTREWLPGDHRYETLAEYTARVRDDLDRCIRKLRALGVDPGLFAFPFSAATRPTNDLRVVPILYRLVAERFTASLVDSAGSQYVSRAMETRYELPRFLVRSTTTARTLFADLATHAPRSHTGNLARPISNWVVDQRALSSGVTLRGGLRFAPPRQTWISTHWAPTNALPLHDATLHVVASHLGTTTDGSSLSLVVRPDGNQRPATVTLGPATLRIRAKTSLTCRLTPASSHHMAVTYRGTTLMVAVDDRRAATVRIATAGGTGIGIGAWRDTSSSPRPVLQQLVQAPRTTVPAATARLQCSSHTS